MRQPTEEWRAVPGWEGAYEVSSLGRVRSLTRTIATERGSRTYKGRMLSPGLVGWGYRSVRLRADGRVDQKRVHQLVAAAFVGPCPEGFQVHHKDGNKENNQATNLEYVTPSENSTNAQSSLNRRRRLSDADIREIRALRGVATYHEIANRFGIGLATAWRIANGETWRSVE